MDKEIGRQKDSLIENGFVHLVYFYAFTNYWGFRCWDTSIHTLKSIERINQLKRSFAKCIKTNIIKCKRKKT